MTRGLISMLKIFRGPAGCVEMPEYEKIGYQQSEPKPPDPFDVEVETRGGRDDRVAPPSRPPQPPPDTGVEEEDVPPPPRCSQERLSCEPKYEEGRDYYRLDDGRAGQSFDAQFLVKGAEWFRCDSGIPLTALENSEEPKPISYGAELNRNYCAGRHPLPSGCRVECGTFKDECGDISVSVGAPEPFDIQTIPFSNAGVFLEGENYWLDMRDRSGRARSCNYSLTWSGNGSKEGDLELPNGRTQFPISAGVGPFSHVFLNLLDCADEGECVGDMNRTFRYFTLVEGIVHYWSFGRIEGNTVFDYAGRSHDGEIRGNPFPFSEGTLFSRILDGNGDYVTTTEPEMLGIADTWTISFWVHRTGRDSDTLIHIGDAPDRRNTIHLVVNNEGRVGLTYYDRSGEMGQAYFIGLPNSAPQDIRAAPPTVPPKGPLWEIGRWHHVVLAKFPGTGSDKITLYVDGTGFPRNPMNANSWGQQSDSPRHIRFGKTLENSNDFFNGRIAEISIYDRRLETPEIREICRHFDPQQFFCPPQ